MARTCPDTCALCISNKKGRSNIRGHFAYRARRPRSRQIPPHAGIDQEHAMLARRVAATGNSPAECPPELEATPNLWDFISQVLWPDGSPRVPGTVTLFISEDGRLKAVLNDKDAGLTAFTTYSSEDTIFDWLDGAVIAESTDWRQSRTAGQKKSR